MRSARRAAAGAAAHLPPAWVAAALRAARPALRRTEPFASFELDDGRRLALVSGYRDRVKARWRSYWWATRTLLALEPLGVLTEDARDLVVALSEASTLPAPLQEFAAQATAHAERFPDLIRPTGRIDTRLGLPIVAALAAEDQIRRTAHVYAVGARQVAAALQRFGVELAGARLLEAGCGRGYTAAALAAAGAGEVVGIDLDTEGEPLAGEVRAVRTALAGDRAVRIDTGDVRRLPYPDLSFDAVVSLAVLEHVDDVAGALHELHRVTRRGGIGYHGIDVWFGTAGGHSLCTLDAPWAHVRLGDAELERYLREVRPHEADDAIRQLGHAFQQPRLTLREVASLARAAGFEVLSATLLRLPLWDPHRAWFGSGVLRECRRVHPAVRGRDLLSVSATLVLRRR